MLFSNGVHSFAVSFETLMITLLSGAATASFVILWIISVKNGSYVMLEVFLTLSIILTTALCKIFFDENIRINQISVGRYDYFTI